jgi:integrase
MSREMRGHGNVYQPTYRDRHGKLKHVSTWWIFHSVKGRRITENTQTEEKAVAKRLLKRRIGEAGIGKRLGPEIDRATISDLLALVEADYAANSRRSLDRVKQAGKHLRDFLSGDAKVRELSTNQITKYKVHRLGEGAKPSTVNYELAILRRGFGLGVEDGCVGAIPTIKKLEVHNARQGFFEPEQYRAVKKHLPDYLKPVAEVAYITGWRTRSELLTRQWRHIDFVKGWLNLEPGEGKTREARSFPFTPELRTVLEVQRGKVREIERRLECVIPWVFVHEDGSRIRDFRGAWKEACKDALVPGRLVHDFRRTAVRNLESAGVSRSSAMKLTGHKTEAVYVRYAIQDEASLMEAAEKLAKLHATLAIKPASDTGPKEKCESSAKVSA